MADTVDGKRIANDLRTELAAVIADLPITPTLATVLVGDNRESATYVRLKHKACAKLGIGIVDTVLGNDATQAQLEQIVQQLNDNPAVHGILVQLPLLDGMDEERIIDLIVPTKDVDGFSPINLGLLAQRGRKPHFTPATPAGVMHLIKTTRIDLRGKNAVVVGRSNIVGMPTALLLKEEDATVTITHRHTADLAHHTRNADVLVVAAGKPHLITADMIKPNAVVIDVGVNYVDDPSAKRGYRIMGDVDFEAAVNVASHITPVPGGVGPMTITMLLQNVVTAAQRSLVS